MEGYNLNENEIEEIAKCMDDPIYFIETYCKIVNVDEGLISFKMFDKQKEMIHVFHENRFSIALASRQFGKSVTVAGYILYVALFNPKYTIGVLADQEKHAIEILDRIKIMIDYLPDFLKPVDKNKKLIEDNKTSIIFSNKSKIFGAPTTEKSIRGQSLNCVDGKSKIVVRNKKTQKIEEISIDLLRKRLSK